MLKLTALCLLCHVNKVTTYKLIHFICFISLFYILIKSKSFESSSKGEKKTIANKAHFYHGQINYTSVVVDAGISNVPKHGCN